MPLRDLADRVPPLCEGGIACPGFPGTSARILRSLYRLAATPRSAANVRALRGDVRFRLRVGDWRVIYKLLDDVFVVLVLRIAHRREVYR